MKREVLEQLVKDRADKRPAVLVTNLDNGDQVLWHPDNGKPLVLDGLDLSERAYQALADDRSALIEEDGHPRLFLQVFNPPLRMLIVGAVHITQPLAQMADLAGFDVTVIDPRAAFGSDVRFPGIPLSNAWPDEALEELAPDSRTAIVTLTHDPKIDDPALIHAVRSDVFYIGALGSPRTHAKRVERLRQAGLGDDEIARIHAPIGLAIHAKSPAEIAVAILAQVIESLRGSDRS